MKEKDKEIEVVENLIRILKRCLKISKDNKRFYEVIRIKHDILICKKELKLLKQEREKLKNAAIQ